MLFMKQILTGINFIVQEQNIAYDLSTQIQELSTFSMKKQHQVPTSQYFLRICEAETPKCKILNQVHDQCMHWQTICRYYMQ